MQVNETNLPGVLLITPRLFKDDRGFFYESFNVNRYAQYGLTKPFVQDNISRSARNVVRGLHYQLNHPQAKLVSVLCGAVLDVVVDVRKGSPTFGQYFSTELNDENHAQVYIPEGYAHGFVSLTEGVDFSYKCTDYYDPTGEFGIIWDDPDLGINWHAVDPILSPKDKVYPRLKDIPLEHLPTFEK